MSDSYNLKPFNHFKKVGIPYAIEGLIVFVANILIVLAIGRYGKLRARKEYIIIGALALADAGSGLAFLLSAVYRYTWYAMGVVGYTATPWYCFTIYNALWFTFDPLASFMLTVVSIDRLYAVSAPLSYFTKDYTYAIKFCGIVYVWQLLQLPVLAWISYSKSDVAVPAICWSDHAVKERWYDTYFYGCKTWAGLASIVIYAVVIVWQVVSSKKNKISASKETEQSKWRTRQREEEMKRQQRLIVTLGLSSLFTLLFMMTPSVINVVLTHWFPQQLHLKTYFALLKNVNPMLNLVLYVTRHKEMRSAIVCLLKCKSGIPDTAFLTSQSGTSHSTKAGHA